MVSCKSVMLSRRQISTYTHQVFSVGLIGRYWHSTVDHQVFKCEESRP